MKAIIKIGIMTYGIIEIWTTQYSHFTLDEVGKDVDANSPT